MRGHGLVSLPLEDALDVEKQREAPSLRAMVEVLEIMHGLGRIHGLRIRQYGGAGGGLAELGIRIVELWRSPAFDGRLDSEDGSHIESDARHVCGKLKLARVQSQSEHVLE